MKVAAGVIFNESGEILINKRLKNGVLPGYWEFPGGKVEAGESLEAGLVREIKEEFGIMVEVDELLCETEYDYGDFEVELSFFACKLKDNGIKAKEGHEWKWVKRGDLYDYAFLPANQKVINLLWPENPPG